MDLGMSVSVSDCYWAGTNVINIVYTIQWYALMFIFNQLVTI